ncbi:MAG: glycosyltransferase family 4 protein, partial [Smithella sp.]
PEVVEDGRTGFVVNSIDEIIAAIKKIPNISRSACRELVEQRFDVHRMADDYLKAYEKIIQDSATALT